MDFNTFFYYLRRLVRCWRVDIVVEFIEKENAFCFVGSLGSFLLRFSGVIKLMGDIRSLE